MKVITLHIVSMPERITKRMINMTEYPIIDTVATGRRIKELRTQNHIKVDEIAEFIGLESTQAVFKWQRGDCLPTVDNLFALSRLFGTTVDNILIECDSHHIG